MRFSLFFLPMLFAPMPARAAVGVGLAPGAAGAWGVAALIVFAAAYVFVILEEIIHLKKSKPMVLAAGLVWICAALAYAQAGRAGEATQLLRHTLLEYAEMAFFLLAAMAYINVIEERNVFQALRARMAAAGLSLRGLYWTTGVTAFFLSPIADNLTTALVMGAVLMAAGAGHPRFLAVACVNIVVAANAGGAFSPFGDITTLMVWQKGLVSFAEFFALFFPALVSWLVPAALMSCGFANAVPSPAHAAETSDIKPGGGVAVALFLVTIAGTVVLHHALHLPPFLGMMTGLGLMMAYGHFLRRNELKDWSAPEAGIPGMKPAEKPFDVFISIKRVEWDTLIFFYGVLVAVGGLAALGYLDGLARFFYGDLGPTVANIFVGIASAVVDNIPVMFAVLHMNPEMGQAQWLLVTLTAGIGGSLLSIGSAAGVALMGQARGAYTFFSHLKWAWAVALGYAAGIGVHVTINGL